MIEKERIKKLEALADAVRGWIEVHNELEQVRDGNEWFIKNEQVQDAEWKMERRLCKLDEPSCAAQKASVFISRAIAREIRIAPC